MSNLIKIVEISKRFGDIIALENVSLDIDSGEIIALLGENGSGKTTLAKILYGIYTPDKGYIEINGIRKILTSPAEAKNLGIVMVSQRPQLIDELTALENISIFLNTSVSRIHKNVENLLHEFNIDINVSKPVYTLSYTEKQYVEMIKALLAMPKLMIVDEATTYLPLSIKLKFFNMMKKILADGSSIIFITHKILEALEFSNRIIVLRKGRIVGRFNSDSVTVEELRKTMFEGFGGISSIQVSRQIKDVNRDIKTVLKIDNVSVLDEYSRRVVDDVSLDVKQGEISVIVGIAGNGQKELCEAIVGLRKVEKGRILFEDKDVTKLPPSKRIAMGFHYIPEDPFRDGVFLNLTIAENLKVFSQRRIEKEILLETISKLNIIPANPIVKVYKLSGGNIQKVAISRIFINIPRIIIAYNPTRMLDEYSSKLVMSALTRFATLGGSALIFSEDLDEALAMGDKIAVMVRGKIVKLYDQAMVERSELEKVMTSYD
uniref:ATP-binding cassette domain-containing protein n=2 Tax=Ignisphaera aggregans TaxID=334771 RepID=A0A7C5UVU7_9CREN